MIPIELTSKVGPDGVLKLTIPVGPEAANQPVRVTVEAAKAGALPEIDDWQRFIHQMAGCITDPTFARQEQGQYDRRDELFP